MKAILSIALVSTLLVFGGCSSKQEVKPNLSATVTKTQTKTYGAPAPTFPAYQNQVIVPAHTPIGDYQCRITGQVVRDKDGAIINIISLDNSSLWFDLYSLKHNILIKRKGSMGDNMKQVAIMPDSIKYQDKTGRYFAFVENQDNQRLAVTMIDTAKKTEIVSICKLKF